MSCYLYFILYTDYDDHLGFNVQPQPIQFLKEPDDCYAFSGATITFVCKAILDDYSITWYHNNTIIDPTGLHYNITSNDYGTSILIVRNVTTDDQGEYHCCVSEWRNKVKSRNGYLKGINYSNT